MISAELKHLHHQLKTWTAVSQDAGPSEREFRVLLGTPGAAARASRRTRSEVRIAHERHNPFPLPWHMRLAREALIPLKARPGSTELSNRIVEIEGMLSEYEGKSAWTRASRHYLLGFTALSRALHHNNQDNWFGGRTAWPKANADAMENFMCGRGIIAETSKDDLCDDDRALLNKLDHALLNNWICAIAAQAKFGKSRDEINGILREARATDALREFLRENPFLWQAASNGLSIASMLESSDKEMLFFYEELKRLDSGFQSFDYSPGEIPSLSADPDLAYFCRRFRESLHVDI